MSSNAVPLCVLTQLSITDSGTRDGLGSATVCPRSFNILNPSPVDPVSGCDAPPVEIIIFLALNSPLSVLTPIILFSFLIRPFTFVPICRVMFSLLMNCSITLNTSIAFSVFGNTLFRFCVTSGKPLDSKNLKVSRTPNCVNREYSESFALP